MNRRPASLPKSPLNTQSFLRRARARFVISAIALAAGTTLLPDHSAKAAARTWVGSASTDWAALNGFNTIPVTGDSLVFGADGTAGAAAGDVLTNTLTSTAFNIAGITFNAGAPAYTMTGNTFTLTSGITNNSSNLQTFSNTGISGTPVTPTSTTGLTTAAGLTFATGTAGITLSGLQFTMTGTTGVTTTVNGTGTFTIGVLGLDIGSTNRIVQTFNGSAPIVVTTVNSGGTTSAGNNSFGYAGTGSVHLERSCQSRNELRGFRQLGHVQSERHDCRRNVGHRNGRLQ